MNAATTSATDPSGHLGRVGPACPSLLAPDGSEPPADDVPPGCLADLHLDAVVEAMAPSRFQRRVWHRPLSRVSDVEFRQDVVRDLQRPELRDAAGEFVVAVAAARASVSARAGTHYEIPADLNLTEAISVFTTAVRAFVERLTDVEPRSVGLRAVAAHLAAYVQGNDFRALADGAAAVLADLRTPPVLLGLQHPTVWMDDDSGRPAWAGRIAEFFARFGESPGGTSTVIPPRPLRTLNNVEAQAIGLVASLRPHGFERLQGFVAAHADFLPDELVVLAAEMRFYLGFLAVADELEARGVTWCLPRVSPSGRGSVQVEGCVDIALALTGRADDRPLVPNDLFLSPDERVAFVTGPNQGGKTTFVRSLGQLAHLASLGLPVPARAASLPLFTPVLTHFPQPDDPEHFRGGLADELVRLHGIMDAADGASLVVFNELFSATSAEDAVELAERVVPRLVAAECRVLWVTFLEDLLPLVDDAVSLVGQVASDDSLRPTFVFRPQPPSGRFHAAALAARHGLSREDLARRLS